jgi:hypothetical protein
MCVNKILQKMSYLEDSKYLWPRAADYTYDSKRKLFVPIAEKLPCDKQQPVELGLSDYLSVYHRLILPTTTPCQRLSRTSNSTGGFCGKLLLGSVPRSPESTVFQHWPSSEIKLPWSTPVTELRGLIERLCIDAIFSLVGLPERLKLSVGICDPQGLLHSIGDESKNSAAPIRQLECRTIWLRYSDETLDSFVPSEWRGFQCPIVVTWALKATGLYSEQLERAMADYPPHGEVLLSTLYTLCPQISPEKIRSLLSDQPRQGQLFPNQKFFRLDSRGLPGARYALRSLCTSSPDTLSQEQQTRLALENSLLDLINSHPFHPTKVPVSTNQPSSLDQYLRLRQQWLAKRQ